MPAASLYRSYTRCLDMLKSREKSFFEFNSRFEPQLLAKWNDIDEVPRKVGKKVISAHRSRLTQRTFIHLSLTFMLCSTCYLITGPPTQAKVHDTLAAEEYVSRLAGEFVLGEAGLITKGLNLEHDKYAQ